MTALLYVVVCGSALVAAVATAVRAVAYARAPLHLRWELYPVPHEARARAGHGGSYFETGDWWTHQHRPDRLHELEAMATEIVFLKALHEFNRPLWRRSFPFHFGLYLLIATAALLFGTAAVVAAAPSLLTGPAAAAAGLAYRVTGALGIALTLVGAAGLLHRRLTDEDLRPFTTPGDLFNLAAFIVVLALLGAGMLLRGADQAGPGAIVLGLLTWNTQLDVPPLLAAGIAAAALLTAYVPFTHMSHFVGKYFTYHHVRWDDAVNRRGGAMERKLAEYLTYRPTWAAPHVRADGVRTWAEVATINPAQEVKR